MNKELPQKLEETEIFQNNSNLADFFNTACSRHKDLIAFESFDVEMSYKQLAERASHLASWFSNNANVGDKVAVMMPNMMAYPVIVYGALKAGMTVVNINPLYTKRELEHVLKDSGARILLCWEGAGAVVASANLASIDKVVLTTVGDLLGFKGKIINLVIRKLKKLVPKFSLSNTLAFGKVMGASKDTFTDIDLPIEHMAFLQYTGGTTGVSKGAILTHRNLMANAAQAYHIFNPEWFKSKPSKDDQVVVICPLPLYHIFALTAHTFALFYHGAKNVLITNPRDLKTFVGTLKKHEFHVMSGVNTLFEALLNNEDFRKLDFSRFISALSGGMATLPSTAERWKDVTGTVLLQAYGLTETSPLVTAMEYDSPAFTGSIGKVALFTEVEVRDDSGQVLPIGEAGELCVRGPQVMQGYWKSEDSGVDKDGWFNTGDIATIDETGHIFIVDRKKDMIIISGFNVYPNEVEAVVAEHPAILECGCVGVESEKSQEAVKVFAVLREGQSLTAEELIAFCRENLTAYKVPKHVEFIADLPKTNVGKVLRRELKNL